MGNPEYKSFDDCEVIRCIHPGSLECENQPECPKLTRHHKIAKVVGELAIKEYGQQDERTVRIRRFINHHSNIVFVGDCLRGVVDQVAIKDLAHLPSHENMQTILDADYAPDARIDESPEEEPEDLALVALEGLKESVRLGYMQERHARAIYAIYFPDDEWAE